MRRAPERIWQFLAPIVANMGYEFVGAGFGQGDSGLTLRLYIDSDDGISVDDCAAVSNQVGAALDVDDLIAGEYCLEVSSPGLDRPLFVAADYQRFIGSEIKLKLAVAQLGRRNYRGLLCAADETTATIEIDGEQHQVPIGDVDTANLVPKF